MWRFRQVVNLLIKYYIWLAVFDTSQAIGQSASHTIFGYTQSQMLTYIMLSSVISSFVLATKTADVAGEIVGGRIIDYVLRPLSFLRFQAARDAADKLLNMGLQLVEVSVLILLLQPVLFVQTDPLAYIVAIVFLFIGTIIAFFINLSVSFVGFWTPEVWAPRFMMMVLVLVFSGSFFPLDVIPKPIYYILFLTPFPYLYFLPTRAYLGLPSQEIIFFFVAGIAWVYLSYSLARGLWNKGLREFSFFGR